MGGFLPEAEKKKKSLFFLIMENIEDFGCRPIRSERIRGKLIARERSFPRVFSSKYLYPALKAKN